jgi:hypothetical protein
LVDPYGSIGVNARTGKLGAHFAQVIKYNQSETGDERVFAYGGDSKLKRPPDNVDDQVFKRKDRKQKG